MQAQLKRVLLASAIFVAVFAIPLHTQTFGEVTGHISDASGAAVPAAKIALTNVATNAVRRAVSTGSGGENLPRPWPAPPPPLRTHAREARPWGGPFPRGGGHRPPPRPGPLHLRAGGGGRRRGGESNAPPNPWKLP